MNANHPNSILIVEDNQLINDHYKELFIDQGFIVHQANDGFEGLVVLRDNDSLDAILLDLQMLKMGGYEFLARTEVDRERLNCHVTVSTGLDCFDRGELLKTGVERVILKPFPDHIISTCISDDLKSKRLLMEKRFKVFFHGEAWIDTNEQKLLNEILVTEISENSIVFYSKKILPRENTIILHFKCDIPLPFCVPIHADLILVEHKEDGAIKYLAKVI